jgi:hypothetical protein
MRDACSCERLESLEVCRVLARKQRGWIRLVAGKKFFFASTFDDGEESSRCRSGIERGLNSTG